MLNSGYIFVLLILNVLGMEGRHSQPVNICELSGTVFIEEYPGGANFFLYEEDSEAFADFLIYETDNHYE